MVSRQLVYVTGMLEVILGPFRPLGAAAAACEVFLVPEILAGVPDGPFRLLGAAAAACEVFLVPGNLGQRP